MSPAAWILLAAQETFRELLFRKVVDYSYLGVFLYLVACGLGFPSPEEVALVGGGYAVYRAGGGWPEVLLMVGVAMAGVFVGDTILWSIGRRVGDHPERVPIFGRHLTLRRMKKARALFRRHGAKAVFFARFLFGIRAVTFFVSGTLRVPYLTFLAMDGLGALLSVPISVLLAWHFGGELELAFVWIGELHRVVLLSVLAAIAVTVFLVWRRRRSRAGEPEDRDPDESGDDAAPLPARALPPAAAPGAPPRPGSDPQA